MTTFDGKEIIIDPYGWNFISLRLTWTGGKVNG
jgi:hypothetical protein